MSGIYIPGIEMPKSCDVCVHPTCMLWQSVNGGERHENCPIIPVPEHGRLGDLDELLDRAFGCLDEETFLAFQFLVNGSVTIIPASKEGEG